MSYKIVPKKYRKKFSKDLRIFIWAIVRGFFMFPIIYKKRRELFDMGEAKDNLHLPDNHLYWLFDCSEHIDGDPTKPLDFDSCVYGDPVNRRVNLETAGSLRKFYASLRWLVFRNSAWNLKLKKGINHRGKRILVNHLILIGSASLFNWRDQHDAGEQGAVFYFQDDPNHEYVFAWSKTVPIFKLNPLRLLGYKWFNKKRGYDAEKIEYKNRYFKFLYN